VRKAQVRDGIKLRQHKCVPRRHGKLKRGCTLEIVEVVNAFSRPFLMTLLIHQHPSCFELSTSELSQGCATSSLNMSVASTMLARKKTKLEVFQAYSKKLSERGDIDISASGFLESLRDHFNRLPTRYALDVNIDSLDVLSHKRLLEEARSDPTAVSFAIRPVEVVVSRLRESSQSPAINQVSPHADLWHHPLFNPPVLLITVTAQGENLPS
jgi:hypothetical protein